MRRNISHAHLSWADKTMSALRGQDLEDAEKRLRALPSRGIFDISDETHTEEIWATSMDAQDGLFLREMHTSALIRKLVLSRLLTESMLLTHMEQQLINRSLRSQSLQLSLDFGEYLAAEALCRRLWATCHWEGELATLTFAGEVLFPQQLLRLSQSWEAFRKELHSFELRLSAHLSQWGMIREEEALRALMSGTVQELELPDDSLPRRWLETSFQYIVDSQGRRIIIHPGLAEAAPLLAAGAADMPLRESEAEDRDDVDEALCLVDQSLYDEGLPLLEDTVRPELYPTVVLEDLFILARQGVSEAEMLQALAASLIVVPTQEMALLIHHIVQMVPRWDSLHTGWVM